MWCPDGVDLERWIRSQFKDDSGYVLMKIIVPRKDRMGALRSLNRIQINHLSLFPDLYGASEFCRTERADRLWLRVTGRVHSGPGRSFRIQHVSDWIGGLATHPLCRPETFLFRTYVEKLTVDRSPLTGNE